MDKQTKIPDIFPKKGEPGYDEAYKELRRSNLEGLSQLMPGEIFDKTVVLSTKKSRPVAPD